MTVRSVFLIASSGLIGTGCTLVPETTAQTGVPSNVGEAIAAMFSGGEQEQSTQQTPGSVQVSNACSDFEESDNAGPDGIDISASVQAGNYGPVSSPVTVTGDDDCEDDSGNPNAFASFEVMEDIVATCENGTTVTMLPGSAGVYRNDEAQGHTPEIYGTFNLMDDDGNTYQGIRCMIILGNDENIIEAVCEDASGNVVDVGTSSTTCQFNTSQDNNNTGTNVGTSTNTGTTVGAGSLP